MKQGMTWANRLGFLVVGLALAMTTACGSQSPPESAESVAMNAPSIYAAAAYSLATDWNTFSPGHRFSALLVLERTQTGAGALSGESFSGPILTPDEQVAVVRRLQTLSPTRFVESCSDALGEGGRPIESGAAIIRLAPIEMIDDRTAFVGLNLLCEAHCGRWMTMVVEVIDGEWRATGSTGTNTIS